MYKIKEQRKTTMFDTKMAAVTYLLQNLYHCVNPILLVYSHRVTGNIVHIERI